MKLEILGTGCAKCKGLEKNVRQAVAELGIEAEIVKVDSIMEIMDRGAMMTPALCINDEVVAVGRVLSVEEIKKLLRG